MGKQRMHGTTACADEPDFDEEFLKLVNETITKRGVKVKQIAEAMGSDVPQASRSLRGKRKLNLNEVARISHFLEISPTAWNGGGDAGPESRFLPLCGKIAASVWRAKGSEMDNFLSPIRPINLEDGDVGEQSCYLIDDGPFSGEYIVCVKADSETKLEDEDMVVVEETRTMLPDDLEVSNLSLMVIQCTDDLVSLIPLQGSSRGSPLGYPADGVEVKGVVIGFFRRARKKFATKITNQS